MLRHECAIGVSEPVENIWELSVAYCQTIEALNQAQRTVNFYQGNAPAAYTLNSRLLACQNEILHCLELSLIHICQQLARALLGFHHPARAGGVDGHGLFAHRCV